MKVKHDTNKTILGLPVSLERQNVEAIPFKHFFARIVGSSLLELSRFT